MLKIHNLNKSFSGKQILQDISFSVEQGNIAVFLGGSGVGKSTLLRILNHLEQPDSGTITLNSENLFTLHAQNKHVVGMVFQQFNLFEHVSVMDNITITLKKVLKMKSEQANKIALTLLQKYGLIDQKDFPVSKLSGGQKQRLAIARSLAVNPQIICFDEPTSALDPFLTLSVAENIQKLAQEGYIVIVSTHDMNLVKNLPATLYLLDNKTIAETAPTTDFYAHPERFKSLNNFMQGTGQK
jgi:ABC-type polar amino acid transport system ATPase subunit